MKQPLKILSIIDIPWNSGLAAYAFDQARALRAGGHEVIFACPDGSAAMEFAAREKFRAYAIPGRKEYFGLLEATLRLRELAREEKIDALCAHTGRAQTLAWLLRLKVPLVRVKADAKLPSLGFTFRAVTKVISASAFIEDRYLNAGLDPSRSALIRQGIALPEFEYPPSPPPWTIGLLGRLDPVKGHKCFLQAAADVLRRGIKVKFHIAGYEAGLKYSDLKTYADWLQISDDVVFHGRVEDSFAFMKGCSIGVIASLGSEAVSRAALEWLACGRPLVVTTVGSLPEFVSVDLQVPPGAHQALADKLVDIIGAPEQLAYTGGENRSRAESDFSAADFVKATNWLFESLCRGDAPL
ncbi:MAG TPA: glycosyltransferase family 4 protein [Elusimicrobiales bacterium]|nr:glycosyltransferase family 4 protein [Elusimicrobiales bacterium]